MLLQVTTAMGNKSTGQATHATPTTTSSAHNPTDAMVTIQPTRAGRSQAVMTSSGDEGGGRGVVMAGVERGGGEEALVKDVGREGKRSENNGNFLTNHSSHVTGKAPPNSATTRGGGNSRGVGNGEQKGLQSTTPTQQQSQTQQQQQKGKAQVFSYAQALKTTSSKGGDSTTGRPPSSKLSSRSQTPSESSLLGVGKDMIKGANHGNSGSPVLSGRDDKGAGFLHDDSLDFDLRSNSALSVATDSIISERSASRQSLGLPIDSQPGDDAAHEATVSKSGGEEGEEVTEEVHVNATSMSLLADAKLERDLIESRSHIPPLLPNPSTEQFTPPSPVKTSPITPRNHPQPPTVTVPPLQTSAPSTPTQAPPTSVDQQEVERVLQTPPPALPVSPGLAPENYPRVSSPQLARGSDPASSTRVFDAMKHQTPPTSGLADGKEVLMSAAQKRAERKEEDISVMLPLPLRSGEGMLPNPLPTMSSILPHPPGTQIGFTAHQQQPHLPLHPPGK